MRAATQLENWVVDYLAGAFVAVSSKGKVATSTDGITWQVSTVQDDAE